MSMCMLPLAQSGSLNSVLANVIILDNTYVYCKTLYCGNTNTPERERERERERESFPHS